MVMVLGARGLAQYLELTFCHPKISCTPNWHLGQFKFSPFSSILWSTFVCLSLCSWRVEPPATSNMYVACWKISETEIMPHGILRNLHLPSCVLKVQCLELFSPKVLLCSTVFVITWNYEIVFCSFWNTLEVGLELYMMHALLVLHPLSAGFYMCMAKAEKCLALQMAVNIYLGAGPSGKVDKTKRKESCTLEQNGGCRMRKKKQTNKKTHFNYMVLSAQKSLKYKKDRVNVSVTRPSSTPICVWQASKSFEDIMIMLHNLVNCTCV